MTGSPQALQSPIPAMHILIADSFFEFRQVLRMMLLRDIGVASVEEAKSGKQALAMLKEEDFDLIIADTTMRPMGCIELTTLIRDGVAGIDSTIPVIAVSGQPALSDILSARDAGVNEYLAKPLSAKILELRIRSVLEHPRPYINNAVFIGPDRRRRGDEGFDGSDRRTHADRAH